MRKRNFLLSVSIVLALILPVVASAEVIMPSEQQSSDCKSGTRSDDYQEEDPLSWVMEYSNGRLSITWVNYEANCCLEEEIRSWMEREDGNRLVFNVASDAGMCDCLCKYDVSSSYDGIEPGHYTVVFREYEDYLTVEVDIEEGGRIVLNRAPSAIETVAAEGRQMTVSPDGLLKVEAVDAFSVEIFNAKGVSQATVNGKGSSEISLASLPKGVYIARMKSGEYDETIRFVR